jgi:phytoene dehydrogenase-like protein
MGNAGSNNYDVIIIGAGISGLVCGCYLAKAGMKVLLIEQHNIPGGYFTSFRRKGFLFDAAAHSFGNYREGGHVRKILTDLGVPELASIKRCNPSDMVIAPECMVTYWNDVPSTIAGLVNIFPHEEKSIVNFFKFIATAGISDFVKLKDKTFDFILRQFFSDSRLRSVIALPVFGNGGLPPSRIHAFSGIKIFSEFILDGGYYTEGGIQALPDALAHIVIRNGGTITYKNRVEKILIQNGAVIGVELENHEELHGRFVVSAGDMRQTYAMLIGDQFVDNEVRKHLDTMTPSLSTFILYMGLHERPKDLPKAGVNSWFLSDWDLDATYTRVERCDFSDVGAFMFRVSPDQKTALAFIGAPYYSSSFWKENKRKLADDFFARIEYFIPGLKEQVVYIESASPATLQRYTLNYQGAAFGWAKTPSQTSAIMECKSSRLPGLYFTGHWTSIGFGLPGTCYSGYETAHRILKKETRK